MSKQATRSKTTPKKTPRLMGSMSRYRKLAAWLLAGLVVLGLLGAIKYNMYTAKFSDKDYAAIEEAAEDVMKSVGAEDIKNYEYCSYEAPEKYSSVRLYCSVQMAGYLRYQNDAHAIETARSLERD